MENFHFEKYRPSEVWSQASSALRGQGHTAAGSTGWQWLGCSSPTPYHPPECTRSAPWPAPLAQIRMQQMQQNVYSFWGFLILTFILHFIRLWLIWMNISLASHWITKSFKEGGPWMWLPVVGQGRLEGIHSQRLLRCIPSSCCWYMSQMRFVSGYVCPRTALKNAALGS